MATYKFEKINCNLCGSDDKELISNKGLYGLPANVVLCKNCGLGYLSPRWTVESYLDFYKHEYDKFYRPTLNPKRRLVPQRGNIIIRRLHTHNLLPLKVHSILDIGSGEGQNLIDFKLQLPSAELFAIEVSKRSLEYLKKNNIAIISEDFDSSWDLDNQGKFDFIIMRHVLEHFMNPVNIMRKVRRVLSQKGLVYIALPNSLKPVSKLETAWFRNVHTFYFNKYSLENLMKIVGLEVLIYGEGNEQQSGEIFMVLRKSTVYSSPDFSHKHYVEQLSVFKKKLRRDKSRVYALYKKSLKFFRKVHLKLKCLFSSESN